MKKRLKRVLSLVMALVLTMGVLSSTVSAEVLSHKIDGVYAEKTSSYDEKTGKVTITLAIQGDRVDITTKQNADVVLVVDNSGSMDDGKACGGTSFTEHSLGLISWYTCDSCGKEYIFGKPSSCTAVVQKRITTAINAAGTFADQILNINSNNRLAIIGFSSSKKNGGPNDNNAIKVFKDFSDASKLTEIKAVINGMKADGGTNYSAALKKASDIIAARKDKSRPVYVVFVSDGAPGRTGESAGDTMWNGANQANALKNSGVVLYTIGIELDNNAGAYLRSLASSNNNYYNVTQSNYQTELQKILKEIADRINKVAAGTNAVMKDIVNTDLFENIDISGTGLKLDANGNVIWNIGDIPDTVKTISFTVEPKDGVYGDELKTNKDIILTYKSAKGADVERHKDTIGHPDIDIPSYTVTWVDGDGKIIYEDTYLYEQIPVYDSLNYNTPTKTATSQYSYTFAGWNPTIVPVTGNVTYTAKFNSIVNEYTVTWVNGNGKIIYTEDYGYGEMPAYDIDHYGTPEKDTTSQYSYTFTGWNPTIVPVTGNVTYTAQFDSTVNEYTVTWVNGNGEVIYTEPYEYGETPVYNITDHGTPEKDAKADVTYSFNGEWTPAIVPVTEDTTYTAQFNSDVKLYTVTWINGNKEVIYSEQYVYGQTPVYNSVTYHTPQKNATAQYSYTFTGWTPTIVPVTEDATYTAQFNSTVNRYTVTWVNGNGDIIYTEDCGYGDTPVYNSDDNGTPQKDATSQYSYMFTGWTPTIVPVTEDATYTARFNSTVNKYTVTWVNGNGKAIYSGEWEYGQMPAYDIAHYGTPEKDATAQYSYTFTDWTPAIVPVTEDATYTARFNSTVNKYTVTWVDGNGKEIYSDKCEYGQMPVYNSDDYDTPGKDATAQYSYTFAGWTPAIVPVTEDATYTAQFDSTVNRYIVTWINGNGDVIYAEDYAYGETPVYNITDYGTPDKDATEGITYSFNGEWTPEIWPVMKNVSYISQFDAIEEIPEDPVPLDPPTEEIPEDPVPLDPPTEEIPEDPVPLDPGPKTGDNSNVNVYATILMLSILGMGISIGIKKRKLN